MKSEHRWAGAACCFLLFLAICVAVIVNLNGVLRPVGKAEPGLLIFIVPGAIASYFSRGKRLVLPLIGAVTAALVCLLFLRLCVHSGADMWQEVAWLFSAVFWCGIGALSYMFASALFIAKRERQ